MMKTILLLTFAVFVSGASVKDEKTSVNEDKTLLGELFRKLDAALISLTEPERKKILLENLNIDGMCFKHKFCLAEQEPKKVSGLIKYDDFHTEAISGAPVKEEKTSVKQEKTYMNEEKMSVKEEKTPVKEEKTCMNEEKTSVKEEKTPVKQEKMSVKEEKTLLREIAHKLDTAMKNLPVEPKGKEIFLEDPSIDGMCSEHQFCKAEQELKKVSGLSKYDDFRTDRTLMRDLHMYNVHNGNICNDKPVAKGPVQISLHDFLKHLKKCAQSGSRE